MWRSRGREAINGGWITKLGVSMKGTGGWVENSDDWFSPKFHATLFQILACVLQKKCTKCLSSKTKWGFVPGSRKAQGVVGQPTPTHQKGIPGEGGVLGDPKIGVRNENSRFENVALIKKTVNLESTPSLQCSGGREKIFSPK